MTAAGPVPQGGTILGGRPRRGALALDPRTLMGVLLAASALAFMGKGCLLYTSRCV